MELFKILGTIALSGADGFNSDVDKATEKGRSLSKVIGSGLKTAAKIGGAAIAAAATGVAALTKKSLDNYAEYEQLVGGVETLFKSSSNTVMNYAENAYKTAGLSANEYMNTVTSFSASLLQGLGGDTAEAARIADLAITDMSDNANKMGTDMASIQNAYQGFAKQNYTMLDNLKLGYGGTASEMARLINDSGVLGDTMTVTAENLNEVSFDQMIQAIHKVQDEMGITGTTAAEASSTISGSVSSAKAAWENLITGIADENQNLTELIDNFVESAATVGENIMPRIEQILLGIGSLTTKMSPIIASAIPGLISTVLPSMLNAGVSMITSLLTGIQQSAGTIASGAVQIITSFVGGLISILPMIITTGVQLLVALVEGIASDPGSLISTAITLVVTLVESLISAAPQLLGAAISLIAALVEGIISNLPQILAAGVQIIFKVGEGIESTLSEVVKGGAKIVESIISGISSAWDNLVSWFSGVWDSLFGNLSVNVGVTGSGGGGGGNGGMTTQRFATGIDYVPHDFYPAYLDEGEAVLTRPEATEWRNNKGTASNEEVVAALDRVYAAIVTLDNNMGGNMRDAMEGTSFKLNNREFGRLVKAVK